MLGHNGQFGDFLKELRSLGGMQSPLMDQTGLPVSLQAFDGSPVYDDLATLNRWLETENKQGNARNATFYNILPLHDGNHFRARAKRRIIKFARRNSSTSWITSLPSWKNRAVK
ncbi:cellulose synthase operon protein YhjU [Raoultella ornithinolytica]|nr:cellulose synthase operon protein YhjU [Raoultella ornithinolytica]